MSRGRILFIDAYDSFSNNIVTLLEDYLQVSVDSIHIDDVRFVFNDDAFQEYLQHFDAVVAGPGPGHPENTEDIGLIAKLWTLPETYLLPVLGICLGFQSLCQSHGSKVERLKQPRHGLVTPITHCGKDVFIDTGKVLATQYHSLHVKLPSKKSAHPREDLSTSPESCDRLLPLAWDLSDADNGPILMAARHCDKPFWGAQYHPESVCTGIEGHKLIQNWWREACGWNDRRYRCVPVISAKLSGISYKLDGVRSPRKKASFAAHPVHWLSFALPKRANAANIVHELRITSDESEPILLESGTRDGKPVNPETGRFSIVGLPEADAIRIRYSTTSGRLAVSAGREVLHIGSMTTSEVYEYLERFIRDRRATNGSPDVPFWGGLTGFVSYDSGLETIAVPSAEPTREKPDIWFVLVERSVVLDHVRNLVYVQSLRGGDYAWLAATQASVLGAGQSGKMSCAGQASPTPPARITSQPEKTSYCDKVRACQEQLRAGLSYELCLTDQTHILSHEDDWTLYRRLRSQNPAPFGAYLRLSCPLDPSIGIKILSSSPERFLSWSREGACQYRPIKGTVKKAPGVTRASAEEILRSPKEQAENLMIVDLIRHDLSGVSGYVKPTFRFLPVLS